MSDRLGSLGLLLGALAGVFALTASATSGPELSVSERARRSDRVILATVESVRQEGEVARSLRTVTTLRVRESWKGSGPARVEVVQLGGEREGLRAHVVGDAMFAPGEEVVVFLRCAQARCTLFGLGEGKLRVEHGAVELVSHAGRKTRVAVADLRDQVVHAVPAPARVPRPSPGALPAKAAPAPAPAAEVGR